MKLGGKNSLNYASFTHLNINFLKKINFIPVNFIFMVLYVNMYFYLYSLMYWCLIEYFNFILMIYFTKYNLILS